jgi:peptide/nickel transport system permease protein
MRLGRAIPVFCGALLIGALAAALAPGATPGAGPSLSAALAARDAPATVSALLAFAPLVLPIGLAGAGAVAVAMSGAMSEALAEPYRESLYRLGLSPREILRTYVGRRTLAIATTALGNIVLAAMAATAMVERLFHWPGAGAQFMDAAALGNWPVVAVLVLVIATVRIVADFMGALAAAALTGEAP